jgi:hypothetical protein
MVLNRRGPIFLKTDTPRVACMAAHYSPEARDICDTTLDRVPAIPRWTPENRPVVDCSGSNWRWRDFSPGSTSPRLTIDVDGSVVRTGMKVGGVFGHYGDGAIAGRRNGSQRCGAIMASPATIATGGSREGG